MAKKTFEATLNRTDGGGSFRASIEVGADGWGRVYDTANGLYCGSLNPLRTRNLMAAVQQRGCGK